MKTKHLTRVWIREIERKALLLSDDSPVLTSEYVEHFLRETTVLNELKGNSQYTHVLAKRICASTECTEHNLKSFVMLDYPLSVIETVFREEMRTPIRDVLSGILPFRSGRAINACATKSPYGNAVIFFSEALFAYVWDYFHALSLLPTKESLPEHGILGQDCQHEKIETEFIHRLRSGAYDNWKTSSIMKSRVATNSARWYSLLALMFIWGHELGHVFLGHRRGALVERSKVKAYDNRSYILDAYSLDQTKELDADMFASDLCMRFLQKGVTLKDDSYSKPIHLACFAFLILSARAEGTQDLGKLFQSTHPPAAMRLTYIYLRHYARLFETDMEELAAKEQNAVNNGELPEYDYAKDVGIEKLML